MWVLLSLLDWYFVYLNVIGSEDNTNTQQMKDFLLIIVRTVTKKSFMDHSAPLALYNSTERTLYIVKTVVAPQFSVAI